MDMSKWPNASHVLSKGEEEILWQSERLGAHCQISLLHTMWYINIHRMGLRGVQEHTTMMVENFVEESVKLEFGESSSTKILQKLIQVA